MGSSVRAIVLGAVVALVACGGGGGSGPASAPAPGLVVRWVSSSGPSGGSGTQADAIHLASPPMGVRVTASRGGVAQTFNLAVDPSCTAVSVSTSVGTVAMVGDPNAPPPVTIVPGGPGLWDISWSIVSANKGTCNVTVTTTDGAKATLQVYSEL